MGKQKDENDAALEKKFWETAEILDFKEPKFFDFNKVYAIENDGESHPLNARIPAGFWAQFTAWFARQQMYRNHSDFVRDWMLKGFAWVTSHGDEMDAQKDIATLMLTVQHKKNQNRRKQQTEALDGFRADINYAKENNQLQMLKETKEALEIFISVEEGVVKENAIKILKSI